MNFLTSSVALYPEGVTAEAINNEHQFFEGKGYGRIMTLPFCLSVLLRGVIHLVNATVSNVFLLIAQIFSGQFSQAGKTVIVIPLRLILCPIVLAIVAVATPILTVVSLFKPDCFL